ncbi:hypothetical protein B0H34DRAFT_236265 [Crassisporium funariophilum]|nr:hypothetical protein B0H34DRAFT_236265 [Crassisporium funariophilum]
MSTLPVILYRYDTSPFSHKIDNVLLLKRIPHQRVNVSPMLPRPEITDFLGIVYRRIPILAIGNDVYCDTSLIVSTLERRFPATNGHGTLFPAGKHGKGRDTGLIKAFSKFYADNTLFPPATNLIPWGKLPAAFLKDRSALRGAPINTEAMAANRGISESTLSTHMMLIEEQLSDSREWLFDTESPSLADISVHFVLAWGKSFRGTEALFDQGRIPLTMQWLNRVSAFINEQRENQAAPVKIHGLDAANKIVASTHEAYSVVGFDSIEAARLGVSEGGNVQVAPEDTGRAYPTIGKLVALNREEVVLEVQGSKGLVRCHFPRLGFSIRVSQESKL